MKEDKKLISIFRTYPEIKLVDLFGSMATGSEGPLSDYDFAIYLDTKDKTRMYEIKADMIVNISRLLKTDSIGVVIMSYFRESDKKISQNQTSQINQINQRVKISPLSRLNR